ncbi:DUF805 domain-containing protein [Leucobacter coleopterorum]|uniref:DUF805 domain-containing protein n=1 Tax=Leucobacter coleopterorum TaxID=2714933 RepID=A0ABX6JVJ5_9MICO|nr:DUF805 domain-containing protein [Leucobacter coleopterorum]QIM18016.1 DUF805 domain-containing protein [Leucobacter coleopterorum]
MSIPPNSEDQQPQQPQYAPPPSQYQVPQYAPPPQYVQPQYPIQQAYPATPNYNQFGVPGEPGPGEPFNGASSSEDLLRPLYGATFGQAVRRYFKNYANFDGRASRSEYWWIALFGVMLSIVPTILYMLGLFTYIIGSASYRSYSDGPTPGSGLGAFLFFLGAGLLLVIALGTFIPSLALVWRRLHDANFAGPFYFLSFVPAGSLVVFIFLLMPPNPEGRRFDRR